MNACYWVMRKFEKENLFSFGSKGEFIPTIMSSIAQEESRSVSENVFLEVQKRIGNTNYTSIVTDDGAIVYLFDIRSSRKLLHIIYPK